MLEFKLSRLMAVIFTPDLIISNILQLANKFNKISGNKFNGEFFSLPVPKNALPEFPRLIMVSSDGNWKLEAFPTRINLIFSKPPGVNITPPNISDFGSFANDFFRNYKKETETRVQRLALVCEKYSECTGSPPARIIAEKFGKSEHFLNSTTFELHSHKNYKLDIFKINSWVRFKSVYLADQTKTPALLVENDLNTTNEENIIDFSETDIQKFFQITPNHIEDIFKLFFE